MAQRKIRREKKDKNIYIHESTPVDKIVKCRTKKSKKKEYLVQWEGLSSEHNTWIRGVDVTADLKKAFHQEKALAEKERKRKFISSKQSSPKKMKTQKSEHSEIMKESPGANNEEPLQNVLREIPVSNKTQFQGPQQPMFPLMSERPSVSNTIQPLGPNTVRLTRKKSRLLGEIQPQGLEQYPVVSTSKKPPVSDKRLPQGPLNANQPSAAETVPQASNTGKSTCIRLESEFKISGLTLNKEQRQDTKNDGVTMLLTVEATINIKRLSSGEKSKVKKNEDRDLLGYDEYENPHFV